MYSTVENLESLIPTKELINLTNDTAPAAEINEAVVENCIDYAQELINSYIRNKYSLPLSYIPDLIVQLSNDITAYRLYQRRPRKIPDHIKDNYTEAKEILSRLQSGKQILDLPSEHPKDNVQAPTKTILTNKTANSRIFKGDINSKL